MSRTTLEEPWCCTSCDALLGIRRGERIELRYKAARYVVRGEVTARCRRCGATNTLFSLGRRASSRSPPLSPPSIP